MSTVQLWKTILDSNTQNSYELLSEVKEKVINATDKAEISFGTSGWRGELGSEFTLKNVQIVALALIEIYKTADKELLEALGVSGFEQLQKEGLLIGHDNRICGPEFAKVIASVFEKEGIRVLYGAEATTPEFSAGVEMFDTACAINITPSHNPANYSGIKFNPKDGGPAGPEITSHITRISNELMKTHSYVENEAPKWQEVDILKGYTDFVAKRGTIDLEAVQTLLDSGRITIVSDHVHGATRKRPDALLNNHKCLKTLRTEDDYLFGKIAPEPSSKNMQGVKDALASVETEFKLGVIYDPDGDRIRYWDGEVEIDMNRFGALSFHYMAAHKGLKGILAKSVATSNFANSIANKLGIDIVETAVGFKNFRPVLKPGAEPMALIAFEESDGISGYNNTIEKDAEFGFMLALEIIAKTGKSLGTYLKELQEEFGYFYPERKGFEVDKSMVGKALTLKVDSIADRVAEGSQIKIGEVNKTVSEVLTLDGVKIIFSDESWMLIRPSGTEPKVRIYTECRDESEKEAMFEAAKALFFA